MKRLIYIVVVMLAALPCFGQSYDTGMHSDGFRFVGSSAEVVRTGFTDRHPFEISVTAAFNPTTQEWEHSLMIGVISITSEAIPEGAAILIRTGSGDVIESANTLDELSSRDFHGTVGPATGLISYTNHASYPISEDDLVKLARGGVKKVRIQLAGEFVDSEYKKDKWGEVILAQLRELSAAKNSSGDIREGF